ncbi:MAG: elongation factor G [Caldilineaceae bacterium]|nr:elongation factor G [Caldilineaceae bacterium]
MATYQTDQIRNVAILGHGGSGKTSLVEALLHKTGVINRAGRVEDGATVSDWDAEEQRRGISINLSVAPVEFEETKINLIDTPGYIDFVGEVISALHVAEAGLMLVDAVAGAEVGTELAWNRLDELNKPRIVFINRMGRENASFEKAIDSLREAFPDSNIVPFQLPMGQGEDFKGVVSLVTGKAYEGSAPKEVPVPADMQEAVAAAQVALVEAAAEADDDLIMKYFDGEELTPEEVRRGLHRGVRSGAIVPVYCGSALSDIGLERLLKAMRRYVPAPNERMVEAFLGDDSVEILADSNATPSAAVFKTIIDRYVGRMNYIRVFSGTIKKDANLVNSRTGESHRIASLNSVRGKDLHGVDHLVAGDIGVVTKIDDLLTGDSLTSESEPLTVAPPAYPRPLYSVAVTPATKADSAKLGQSLQALVEEDPTLKVQNISATKQNVLQGMGESHVDVAIRRLDQKFGVSVDTAVPKVPYQETISRSGQAQYRHKKQTGGAGQFAEVHMRVEPLERGDGFQYASEVFGGAISNVFLPSIEKGVKQVLDIGFIAGFPVVDVKAVVFDGKEHPVDSKDIAFQTAGREAFRAAMEQAGPVLLEPIYQIDVTVPDAYMGDIMGDFNTRRGRVLGMEQKGNRTIIKALAPLAEIMRYGTDLRSMTQGRGIYTIEFDHYDPVPLHLTDDIIIASKREAEEE